MGLTAGRQNLARSDALAVGQGQHVAVRWNRASAVERSIELASLRQKIITLGYKYQLTSRKALIPDIGIGVRSKAQSQRRRARIRSRSDL